MNIKNLFSQSKGIISPNKKLSRSDKEHIRKMSIELNLRTDYLTKKDIEDWRNAWQQAINIERPNRNLLYDIYKDCLVDLHLSGCI